MSLAVINLPTNKTESTVSDHVRKIGQGEKGLTLEVIIMDADSSGYDLTNKVITFSENKVGGKIVVDSAKENFERLNDTAGRFRYKLADSVYAASGEAWFSISTPSGDVIDTTKSFNIDVIEDASIHINNDNYVSTLTALETHYKAIIQRTEDDNAALLAKFNQQIKDAVDTGNSNIQKVIDSANELIADWKTELSNEQQALTNLQNDWKKQTDQINTDYQDQKKAIQADANTQLANNKKTNDAALAKLESDKQTAIVNLTLDLQNKFNKIQADYVNWKNSTVTDFQGQLDKLQKELKNDEDTQASIQKAIDAANNAISKIKDVDFTQYVKKEDFNKVIANINTINSPMDIDTSIDPDKITKPGFYVAKNGLAFGPYKSPQGYVAGKLTYLLQIAGESSFYGEPYWHQFVLQPNVGNYDIWHRITYDTGGSLIYTYTFINLKDIYSRVKRISINGGSAVKPDNDGLVNLTVPDPDLSKYETKADAEILESMLTAKINNLPIATMQNSIDLALNKITALETRETFHYSSSISDAKTYSESNPQVLVGSK